MRALFSYLVFGLAVYSIGGLVALLRARWADKAASKGTLRDITITTGGFILLIVLESAQDVWANFHDSHFPLTVTSSVLPIVFLLCGRSFYRLYEHRRDWFHPPTKDV